MKGACGFASEAGGPATRTHLDEDGPRVDDQRLSPSTRFTHRWVTLFRRSLPGPVRRVSTLATANPASAGCGRPSPKRKGSSSSLEPLHFLEWRGRRPGAGASRRRRFAPRLSAVNTAARGGPENDLCRATRATFMGLCSETVPGKRALRLSGAMWRFPPATAGLCRRPDLPGRCRQPSVNSASVLSGRRRSFASPGIDAVACRADASSQHPADELPHPGSRMRGASA